MSERIEADARIRRASLAALSETRIATTEPEVTVVIPVFNKWAVTQRCLRSLLVCDPDVSIQIVVVDDGSTDETLAKLSLLPGVEVVRNGENCGFVHSCNRGAALARGRYVWFLNNDTELRHGTLRALVRRIERNERIGIVGSKLIYPDGRLQEAGNIVWLDATGWNYGRHDDPRKSEYNFVRDVDYVSAASLLIRSSEFVAIGGFDERFAPGYYEDADLCFTVRERGLRVVYEPASIVVHHEGVTSGTDMSSGMKRFQTINQAKFVEKWEAVLQRDHLVSNPSSVYRAARLRHREDLSLLIIDSYVPLYDKEAGSNRLKRLVDGLRDADVRIIFLPDNLMKMAPYAQQLQNDEIEVLYSIEDHRRSWREMLVELLPTVDVVWICRPNLCAKYLPLIREHTAAPIVYDTIDLHHLRLRRQSESEANGNDQTWRAVERLELACADAADRTIVVSDYEAKLLETAGIPDVAIVSTVHDVEMSGTLGYPKTSGVLFIGGYNHTPNVDAATWLIREIMPLVWAHLPNIVVTLLGSNPPASIQALASERVIVPGFVPDHAVATYFRSARVFAAPLRFGAGLKGKVGQALGFGTPIVSTPIGAEGFNLSDGKNLLLAGDAPSFGAAILRLYSEPQLWSRLSAESAAALEPFGASRVVQRALAVITRAHNEARERRQNGAANVQSGVDGDADAGSDRSEVAEIVDLRAQLRALRRREANLFLQHLSTVEELHDTRASLNEALRRTGEAEHRAQLVSSLERQRSQGAYEALLTSISTLRRALDESAAKLAVLPSDTQQAAVRPQRQAARHATARS